MRFAQASATRVTLIRRDWSFDICLTSTGGLKGKQSSLALPCRLQTTSVKKRSEELSNFAPDRGATTPATAGDEHTGTAVTIRRQSLPYIRELSDCSNSARRWPAAYLRE